MRLDIERQGRQQVSGAACGDACHYIERHDMSAGDMCDMTGLCETLARRSEHDEQHMSDIATMPA